MKHFALLLLLTFLVLARAFASETAVDIARNIMQTDEIETVHLTSAIELHNRKDGNGCVLVGYASGVPKVLGYSYSQALDYNNLPSDFCSLLDNYTQKVHIPHLSTENEHATSHASYREIVKPLLGNISWEQIDPFNSKLPKIDNQSVTVGCVGLAFAMLMNYHKWPEYGSGILSYTWWRPDFTTEKISLSLGHNYEWNKIRDSYGQYDERTSEEIDAVATLCRDIAYAAHTDFTTWNSGGSQYYACRHLIDNFDYDPGIRYAALDVMKQSDYINILKTELHAGRPCLFGSANTPAGAGAHAYVCDGYDSNGFFHFNFGWGDAFTDMYYSIDHDGLLGEGQAFYYGIKKNEGGEPGISLSASNDFAKGTDSTIDCQLYFWYFGPPRHIRIGYAVENITTKEIFYYETTRTISEDETGAVPGYMQVTLNDMPKKDGDYIVYPVGGFADGEWTKFTFGDLYQDYFCLSIKNGIKTYSNPTINYPLEGDRVEIDNVIYLLDDENLTATVTFRNRRFDHYDENVVIPPSVEFNNNEYTVNKIGSQAFFRLKPAFHSLSIPATIEEIEERACSGEGVISGGYINEFNIPDGAALKKIGNGAFSGCEFNSFKFPLGLKEIGDYAFTYNPLEIIDIPESVEYLGYRAFTTFGQASKVDVYVHWTSLSDKSINWHAFDESSTTPAFRPYRTLHIPKGTINIYQEASAFFDAIIDDAEAGIDNVDINTDNTNDIVYTLQGIKVNTNAELQPGVYILVSGGRARKIYLTGKP